MKIDSEAGLPHGVAYAMMEQRGWEWSPKVGKWVKTQAQQARKVAAVRISGTEKHVMWVLGLVEPHLKLCGVDIHLRGPYDNENGAEIRVYLNVYQGWDHDEI